MPMPIPRDCFSLLEVMACEGGNPYKLVSGSIARSSVEGWLKWGIAYQLYEVVTEEPLKVRVTPEGKLFVRAHKAGKPKDRRGYEEAING